jgi:hypothetical protein
MSNPQLSIIENNKIISIIDFGIALPGESVKKSLFLRNTGDVDVYNIQIETGHNDVKVLSFPKELSIKTQGKIELSYIPKTQLDKGLNIVLLVSCNYLV